MPPSNPEIPVADTPQDHVKKQEHEKKKREYFDIFVELSGADEEVLETIDDHFKDLPELPKNAWDAAIEIRKFLIKKNFQYEPNALTIYDLADDKKGNCLSLTLLIGALLKEKGYEPEFSIITTPKDSTYDNDVRRFRDLTSEKYFSRQAPRLPDSQPDADAVINTFAPLEHPKLILDGRSFETTSLDELNDPSYNPPAERSQEGVTYLQVASHLLIDRAKHHIATTEDYKKNIVTQLANEAVSVWPDNRDAWAFMYDVAKHTNNTALQAKAINNFERIGGSDSRYHFNRYEMTGDTAELDETLKAYPGHLEAYIAKHVIHETDPVEQRFALACAAWMASFSGVVDLAVFYQKYENLVRNLFSDEEYQEIGERLGFLSP